MYVAAPRLWNGGCGGDWPARLFAVIGKDAPERRGARAGESGFISIWSHLAGEK